MDHSVGDFCLSYWLVLLLWGLWWGRSQWCGHRAEETWLLGSWIGKREKGGGDRVPQHHLRTHSQGLKPPSRSVCLSVCTLCLCLSLSSVYAVYVSEGVYVCIFMSICTCVDGCGCGGQRLTLDVFPLESPILFSGF